jgi:hypothetical protein
VQRITLALALAASSVLAQTPDAVLNPTTCGAYTQLDTAARIRMLSGIQPFGDDIDAADQNAAGQWAEEVAAACAGHPDRLLSDAATQALGVE